MSFTFGAPASGSRPETAELDGAPRVPNVPQERPSWTITKVASTGVIVLRFVGPTRTWEVAEFLGALTEMMPDENANIIFDLRELDGHNPETKQPIKKWLLANKARISSVTVVLARSATILKVAAAVIGLATGIKMKIRDDLDGETSVRNLLRPLEEALPSRPETDLTLEQRCAELQLIVDALPALVFYKDADNRIVRVNRAVTDALGVSGLEIAGTDMDHWLPQDATVRRQAELAAIRSGKAELGAVEQLDLPRHGKRWFATARLPQLDPVGRVTGLVVVSRDITDEKRLESQLLQAQKLDSIGKLAGGVAHDFNNLLTSFFGLITAAQRALPTDSMAHEYLSLMQLAVEGGANFTRQLLAFARRQMIEPRVVDLNRLVRETSALLSRVLGANINIDMQLAGESVPVRVDPSQISQLLMNLALNARDAMADRGTLTFKTRSVRLDDPDRWSLAQSASGRFALLVVEDTGEGLSDEAKDHLFEPFFTSKALGHGTGLGLATCYGIVKQNAGHIAVESERGQGTRFSIYLPEVNAPVEPARPDRRRAPARAGNETILFAEDDDLVRHLSVAALASSGYRLIEAAHGAEALRATDEHAGPIHLLITDVSMPEVGGVEVARRFREIRPDAAVLFITGYAGDLLAELGCDVDVLQKPFSTDDLLARVREVLDSLQLTSRQG